MPVLDKDSSASVQMVAMLLKGEFPGVPRFCWAVVDVSDLADLEARGMTVPQAAGQRYSSQERSWKFPVKGVQPRALRRRS